MVIQLDSCWVFLQQSLFWLKTFTRGMGNDAIFIHFVVSSIIYLTYPEISSERFPYLSKQIWANSGEKLSIHILANNMYIFDMNCIWLEETFIRFLLYTFGDATILKGATLRDEETALWQFLHILTCSIHFNVALLVDIFSKHLDEMMLENIFHAFLK